MAMTLRLTEAEDAALTETAKREGRSKQEVARAAIAEYTSKRTRRRDEAIKRIAAERDDLMRRLGEA
jgi:predicted transcriptional regulator